MDIENLNQLQERGLLVCTYAEFKRLREDHPCGLCSRKIQKTQKKLTYIIQQANKHMFLLKSEETLAVDP